MAKVLVTEQYLEDIADAIRTKLNVGTVYTPGQMAAAILSIVSGEGGVDNITYSNRTLSKTINGSTSTVFTADATPTENSTNPVTSGGVYTELASINSNLTQLSADTGWVNLSVPSGVTRNTFAYRKLGNIVTILIDITTTSASGTVILASSIPTEIVPSKDITSSIPIYATANVKPTTVVVSSGSKDICAYHLSSGYRYMDEIVYIV